MALRLTATPALFCSDRRYAGSRFLHDVTCFDFEHCSFFIGRENENTRRKLPRRDQKVAKNCFKYDCNLQISPTAIRIRTYDHSAECWVPGDSVVFHTKISDYVILPKTHMQQKTDVFNNYEHYIKAILKYIKYEIKSCTLSFAYHWPAFLIDFVHWQISL